MQGTNRKANLLMRACPRCHGDLYLDMLEVDEEYVCLQCGRRASKQPTEQQLRPDPPDEPWREVA